MLRQLPGDRLLIVIGDVTGHGIPSAMVAANACGAAWALALHDGDHDAEAQLRAIDGAVCGKGTHGLLMTCFAAILDPGHGVVEYSNAGQNLPYVVTGGGRGLATLALTGSPLGNRGGDFVLGSRQRPLTPGGGIAFAAPASS